MWRDGGDDRVANSESECMNGVSEGAVTFLSYPSAANISSTVRS